MHNNSLNSMFSFAILATSTYFKGHIWTSSFNIG